MTEISGEAGQISRLLDAVNPARVNRFRPDLLSSLANCRAWNRLQRSRRPDEDGVDALSEGDPDDDTSWLLNRSRLSGSGASRGH